MTLPFRDESDALADSTPLWIWMTEEGELDLLSARNLRAARKQVALRTARKRARVSLEPVERIRLELVADEHCLRPVRYELRVHGIELHWALKRARIGLLDSSPPKTPPLVEARLPIPSHTKIETVL